MRKITKKNAIVIAAIVLSAVAFFAILRSCGKGTPNKYVYAPVSRGTVEKTISVSGMIEVIGAQRLVSRTSGMVSKVYADFNQEVKKGQLLATIDATEIEQRLMKIAAQIESSRLELAIAKDDLESKRSMFNDNLISEKGLERADYNYKTVESRYRQMQVEYNIARRLMSDTRIVAPFNGVIIARTVEDNTPAGPSTPLFVIAPTLKNMRILLSIDESDVGQIKKGQSISFNVSAFPEKEFKGSITQVRMNPVINTTRGGLVTYEAVATCDNDGLLLKPGMTATVTILIHRSEKVLRVPNQALVVSPVSTPPDAKKHFLWRKTRTGSGPLPVERIEVEIGVRGDTHTEIKKNIREGDVILIKYVKGSGN